MESRLAAADAGLPSQLLHAGHDNIAREDVSELAGPGATAEDAETLRRKLLIGGQYDSEDQVISRRTPAWLVAVGLIIMGGAYSIVNHTQSMRMFAARNEWHLKMSVFAAGTAMLVMSFVNLTMGIMGRALFPAQSDLPFARQDAIYPWLVSQIDTCGLKGIVVAGVLAAGLSTYDSIGSSLSALLTRDIYARLFVPDRDDRHYLRIGQLMTPLIIAISFLYIPFLEGGMLLFYLDLTSTFVIPLLTLYIMGTFTRVHRLSGLLGLLAGAAYGILRLCAPLLAEGAGIAVMPQFMTNTFAAYPISMLLTAGTMLVCSLLLGWENLGELLHEERGAWLRASQESIRRLATESAASDPAQGTALRLLPVVLAVIVVAVGCILSFVVFW